MSSAARSFRKIIVAILVIAAALWLQHTGWFPADPQRPRGGEPGRAPAPGGRAERQPQSLPPPASALQRLDGCTLAVSRINDGDSFEVSSNNRRFTVRLYFADCPELYSHRYYGDRLAAQGRYFGGLSEEETIHAGELARDYTRRLLEREPFTVWTAWERVYDSDRVYAFVRTRDGDLAELLVGAGLARIHTKGATSPDGISIRSGRARLRDRERSAREARRGAWGLNEAARR